jgi:Major Facilitator Superfamily
MKVADLARIPRSLIPAERNGRRYVIISMIDAIGNGLFVSGIVVFAIRIVRLDPQHITLSFSVAGLVGILASGTAGRLVDYLTPKRTMLITNSMSGVACVAYCFIHSFPMFLLLTCIDTAFNVVTIVAITAYVAAIADAEERVRLRAQGRSLLNAGFGAGACLAAAVLAIGTTTAYYLLPIGDAVSFFVLVVLVIPLQATGRPGGGDEHHPVPVLPARRNLPFLAATVLNAVLQLHETLTLIIVPLWIVVRTSAPKALICVLIVGNTISCVLFQVRAARGTESLRTSMQKVQLAALVLLPGCVAVALSGRIATELAVPLLVAACASFTGAELFQTAGATGILYALVPPAGIADYAGVFGMSRAAQSVLGPGVVGWLVLEYGTAGWVILGLVTVAAAALQRLAISKAALLLERKASAPPQPGLEPAASAPPQPGLEAAVAGQGKS